MEAKINIAEILKDKPKGIRLYSPIFGDCSFQCIQNETDDICVKKHNNEMELFSCKGLYNILGECLLFPSKHMCDWSKFTWKKGDILVSNDSDSHIIFNGFSKDDYTTFEGKHWINASKKRYISYLGAQKTKCYHIEDDKDDAQTYINTIEEQSGGKLNRETLEIEKTQPEFKDGDIVVYGKSVAICRKIYKHTLYFYVSTDETFGLLFDDNRVSAEGYRFAKEEEKQQLFDALAKKNKAWDAEKKQIVDLKPKIELKPFDKVLVRDGKDEIWEPAFFFRNLSQFSGYNYQTIGGEWRVYCIPYNEETAKLIGTSKEWKG